MGWYPLAAQARTQFRAEWRALMSYLWLRLWAAEVEAAKESMANMVTTWMSPTVIVPAVSSVPQPPARRTKSACL